jgi:uncharacterized protein (UPF0371 family)
MAFDSERYLKEQYETIADRISDRPEQPAYIEFGGKPGDDQHAARVLPGYNPDLKVELLKQLLPEAHITMAVNARDILFPENGRYRQTRIRGDSGLYYGQEAMRLVDWLGTKGLKPESVVLTVTPADTMTYSDAEIIGRLEEATEARGLQFFRQYVIPGYPDPTIVDQAGTYLARNDQIAGEGKNLVVFSPGGGSGKFSVILSEIYRAFLRGESPTFIKFETFPVFNLPPRHPLNLAFEAATADLCNAVSEIPDSSGRGVTTYDKDIQNFELLRRLAEKYGPSDHPVLNMQHPSEMGVNVIDAGITDMLEVIKACKLEIVERLRRYKRERRKGIETDATVQRAERIWDEVK